MLLATITACNSWASELQNAVRTWCVLRIFTWKCASRHSRAQFLDTGTSKSVLGPSTFLAFWLQNALLATAAYNFSTSELQKVVRPWRVFHIFTWKWASGHSGVQFLDIGIGTSKSGTKLTCFVHFCVQFLDIGTTNHWKNAAIRDFSNIWRVWIFFLLTFALLHLRSLDFTSSHLLFICFSTHVWVMLPCHCNKK